MFSELSFHSLPCGTLWEKEAVKRLQVSPPPHESYGVFFPIPHSSIHLFIHWFI